MNLTIVLLLVTSCSTSDEAIVATTLAADVTSRPMPARSTATTLDPPSTTVAGRSVPSITAQAPRTTSLLDELRLSPDQNRFVYDVWQALVLKCMEEKGFAYFIAPFSAVDARPRLPQTIDEVVTYGYNPIEPRLPAEALETVDAVANDPAYRQAYVGDEEDLTDGCRDRALMTAVPLDGEYQELDAVVENAKLDVLVEIEGTPEYLALDAAWSACMAARGHTFAKPGEALSRYVGRPVDQLQIDTRVADLNCQASLAYERTLGELEAEGSIRWIDDNPGVISSIADAKASYLARLAALVGDLALNVEPPGS